MPQVDLEKLTNKHNIQIQNTSYEDSEGNEHEQITIGNLEGLGAIIDYRKAYLFAVPLLVVSAILGLIIFNDRRYEFKYLLFGNCLLGVLLIILTSRGFGWSTLMFWLGNVTIYIYDSAEERQAKQIKYV